VLEIEVETPSLGGFIAAPILNDQNHQASKAMLMDAGLQQSLNVV
jgi:hypothetical protein